MLVQSILAELQHEADNTRKLFDAIPNEVLDYKPNDFNWTIAQLAAHIAETYFWWPPTLLQDELKMEEYRYDKGDISDMVKIKEKLETNISLALQSLEDYPEEKLMQPWTMTMNGAELLPPMPRAQVIRSFLMSHLYHHRGEMIAYLRVNKQAVPGLYGMSYEEAKAMGRV